MLNRPLKTAPHANLRASLKPLNSGRCARGRVQNTTLFDALPRATQNGHSAATNPVDAPKRSDHQLELGNISFGPGHLKRPKKNGCRFLPLGQYTTTRPPHRGAVPRGFNAREGCPFGHPFPAGLTRQRGALRAPRATRPSALWRNSADPRRPAPAPPAAAPSPRFGRVRTE